MLAIAVPIAIVVIIFLVSYLLARKPYSLTFWWRLKLALAVFAGAGGPALGTILLATALQVPLSYASQFAVLMVGGMGLDSAFLLIWQFDQTSLVLPLKQRIIEAVFTVGPSIIVASTTEVLAFFFACVATRVPAIKYFCLVTSCGITIAAVMLFTWTTAWMFCIVSNHEAKQRNSHLIAALSVYLPLDAMVAIKFEKEPGVFCTASLTELAALLMKVKVDGETRVLMKGLGNKMRSLNDAVIFFAKKREVSDWQPWTPVAFASPSSGHFLADVIASCLTRTSGKIVVILFALLLSSSPIALAHAAPGWGATDFGEDTSVEAQVLYRRSSFSFHTCSAD
eukprot:SAG11_NODE_213_length_12262_cov_8.391597_8_plen_339_part_00